jgi:hypothetical protein
MDLVKDIGKDTFRKLVISVLERTDTKVVDTNIDAWFKKYSGEKWQLALKMIKNKLEPVQRQPREKIKLTGICLGTVDVPKFDDDKHIIGVKDNEVNHCIMTDESLIILRDKGTPDIAFGSEYTIDSVVIQTQSGNENWYVDSYSDAPIKFIQKHTDEEIVKRLDKLVKSIPDFKHSECAAVKVKMKRNVYPLQQQSYFELTPSGIDLRMCCKGAQSLGGALYDITFYINPQKFGEQNFIGLFNDHFYSELKNANGNEDDVMGIIRDWIVPEGDLDVYVVGRISVTQSGEYAGNVKMSPVFAMIASTADFDINDYITTQIQGKLDDSGIPREHIVDYIDNLRGHIDETAKYDTIASELRERHGWERSYVEEITNFLLKRGDLIEPVLGTIKIGGFDENASGIAQNRTSPEGDTSDTPKEDDGGEEKTGEQKEISEDMLRKYLSLDKFISPNDINEFGYAVDVDLLEEIRNEMYPKHDFMSDEELENASKDELKAMCAERDLDTGGARGDMIKRIQKFQGE